jgi:hypothetical protein
VLRSVKETVRKLRGARSRRSGHSRSHHCIVRYLSHTVGCDLGWALCQTIALEYSPCRLRAERTRCAIHLEWKTAASAAPRVDPEQLRSNPRPTMRAPPMKHPDSNCDCTAAASPLALRWGCSVCGKTAIMKVSTLAAICDGDTIRNVEPEVVSHQSTPGS